MKKCLLIFAAIICSVCTWGQITYDFIINNYPYIDVEEDEVLFPSEPMWYTGNIQKLADLLNKNLFSFYDLNDDYPTNLQKNEYKKSKEYLKQDLPSFNEVYQSTKAHKFYILYNLRYNTPYDTAKKRFAFRIGVNDYMKTNIAGYMGLGNNLCISCPTNRLSVKKTSTGYGDYFLSQFLYTTTIPESTALRIEKEMENPDCSICLMFIVKPYRVSKEARVINYGGYVGRQKALNDYVLAKTVGLYIVDTNKEEIICDLSKMFSQTTSKRK